MSHRLAHGAEYPYDMDWEAGDKPTAQPPKDWAEAAARGVLADLTDRRNIKRGFEHIDLDVRREIVSSLAEIIRQALAESPEAPLPSPASEGGQP